MDDPTPHVRQSLCLALPVFCKRIDDRAYRREFAVKAVQALCSYPEDEVKCAILEMLGEVIYVFDDDPEGPPLELLNAYMDDIPGSLSVDGDWDVVAAFNVSWSACCQAESADGQFPGVALTLGSKRWDELRDLHQRLQDRAGDKIMRILAASLHELAKILTFDQVEADLLPVYKRCLTCNDEIRERVYEHVDVIVTRLRPEVAWELFQDLAKAWKNGTLGGWRAREQLALHLPSFLETFREVHKGEQVLEVLLDALLDPFAAVREGVTQKIPPAYVVLGDESPVAVKFRNMLLDLSISSHYRRRLTFVRCLREFVKPPPNQRAFEQFFVPALPRLSTDVVDVRLGLAQSIANLFVVGAYYGDETGHIPQEIKDLAKILRDDESADVRDTLRSVDLTRMHKGKGVPHRARTTPEQDRAMKPFDHPDRSAVDQFPEQSPKASRRPSAEVAAQMDGMKIGVEGPETEGSGQTVRPGSTAAADEEGDADLTPTDPFSMSFARAAGHRAQ
jgi:serine/threonine-protein phosphatase 4 regulatory subunit 1